MLVAFNTNPQIFGGGGFHFIRSLAEGLHRNGHSVAYDLKHKPDAIIIVAQDVNANFTFDDVAHAKRKYNSKVLLRINNLDTHAKKGSIPHYKKYGKIANAAVYMSSWAQQYAKDKHGLNFGNEFVVHNCPQEIFFSRPQSAWDGKEIFRIVTHHWSTNNRKGFDLYSKIGKEVSKSTELSNLFHLCYIGRSPKRIPGFVMKPFMRGRKLVDKIAAQHVYLTASELEVGPNHVIEGLACGLPVLYGPNGGAVAEYVGNCGFQLNHKDPVSSLMEMRSKYATYRKAALDRKNNYDPHRLCNEYLNIIERVCK